MKELTLKTVNRILAAGAAVGAAGGLLRGAFLFTFDKEGLPTAGGQVLEVAHWALLALEVIAAVALWFAVRKSSLPGKPGGELASERIFLLGGAVMFGLGAAFRLSMSYRPFSVWGIALALICICVAAAVPVTAKSLGSEKSCSGGERMISLLPVVASAILMIELYRGVSRDPSVSWYGAEVFAMAAVMLVFFAAAGDVNGRTGPAKVAVTAFAAVELGLTAALGRLARELWEFVNGGSAGDLISAESFYSLLFLGGVFFAVGAAKTVARRGSRAVSEEPSGNE